MSSRHLRRNAGKVLLLAGLCLSQTSLTRSTGQQTQRGAKTEAYGPPVIIATLKNPSINESSGLVASRTRPGAYWTHNDSGDGPFVYAFNATGASLGTWKVVGATAIDWEDIAAGPGPDPKSTYLYIGDIGDNNKSRDEIVVYRLTEPPITPKDRKSTKSKPGLTERAEVFRLRYPDGKHDAEALLVHPVTGDLYVVSKVALSNASVYSATAPLTAGKVITLKRLGELKLPSLFGGIITGGDISPDGKRLALCDYFQGYEAVLPARARSFDAIWQERLTGFSLGKRKQGESIAYRLDGRALLATSEGKSSELIQVVRQ
jgi:hypothetical protein